MLAMSPSTVASVHPALSTTIPRAPDLPAPVQPTAPVAISIENVSKTFRLPHQQYTTLKERALHPLRSTTYDELQAVKDITLEIAEGEFFGIVGRNGSGKSTLLKCIAGIYGVDSGRISIAGRLSPFIELGVGFNVELTARDNVIINAIMLGLSRRQATERFDAGDRVRRARGLHGSAPEELLVGDDRAARVRRPRSRSTPRSC